MRPVSPSGLSGRAQRRVLEARGREIARLKQQLISQAQRRMEAEARAEVWQISSQKINECLYGAQLDLAEKTTKLDQIRQAEILYQRQLESVPVDASEELMMQEMIDALHDSNNTRVQGHLHTITCLILI